MPTTRFMLPTGELIFLTSRQLDILQRLAAGDSNKEIAAATGLAYQTIANAVQVVLEVLHTRNRTEAVMVAMWGNIIIPALPNLS